MATKEEYQEELDFLIETAIRTELRNRAAEALAARDAAREESKVLSDFADKLRAIVKPNDDRMMSLNDALNAVQALKEQEAAQPAAEAGPIVGGVKDRHLDAIAEAYGNVTLTDEAFRAARAAIRAQKRVDEKEIRGLIERGIVTGYAADCILRAIGDEPGEAPASAPQAEPSSIKSGDTFSAPLVSLPRVSLADPAPPSAPAEAEGPYRANSDWLCEGSYEYDLGCEDTARTIARRANLGWKAEQGKLVRPPETREEMLCEFLRLAIELGDEKPIGFDQVCACPATAWEERERVLRPFVRAHLAKRKAAEQKEAARD